MENNQRMTIKYKFIEGEGYMISSDSRDGLEKCSSCGAEINDDEVFYFCQRNSVILCKDCQLNRFLCCQSPPVCVIPKVHGVSATLCVHKKILRKIIPKIKGELNAPKGADASKQEN